MSLLPKKERGLGATLKTVQLLAAYRFSLAPQVFSHRKEAIRHCVSCDSRVTNRTLGGNSGRSALTGLLWCLQSADYPRQLLLNFGEGER
jgi:hypothetical protein